MLNTKQMKSKATDWFCPYCSSSAQHIAVSSTLWFWSLSAYILANDEPLTVSVEDRFNLEPTSTKCHMGTLCFAHKAQSGSIIVVIKHSRDVQIGLLMCSDLDQCRDDVIVNGHGPCTIRGPPHRVDFFYLANVRSFLWLSSTRHLPGRCRNVNPHGHVAFGREDLAGSLRVGGLT